MMKKLIQNYSKLKKIYMLLFIVTSLIFILVGPYESRLLAQRGIIVGVMALFLFFISTRLKKAIERHMYHHNWDKNKKTIILQLNIFFVMGVLGTITTLIFSVIQPQEIPMALFF